MELIPDKPIAWGVSSYGKLYNWLFFYNGYHAEHHFRPKVHWTKMEQFRHSIARPAESRKASARSGTRTCLVSSMPICQNAVSALRTANRQKRYL